MAENDIKNPEELKAFHDIGYCYEASESDENHYIFVRKIAKK